MSNIKKGFTLIELLVVIAIIGILATVVLASLGTARTRAADAKIQSQIASTRGQAEIFAIANSNLYTGLCADASFTALISGLTNFGCGVNAGGTTWAANAQLSSGNYICADWSGKVTTGASDTISSGTDGDC